MQCRSEVSSHSYVGLCVHLLSDNSAHKYTCWMISGCHSKKPDPRSMLKRPGSPFHFGGLTQQKSFSHAAKRYNQGMGKAKLPPKSKEKTLPWALSSFFAPPMLRVPEGVAVALQMSLYLVCFPT